MLRIIRHLVLFGTAVFFIYSGLFTPWPNAIDLPMRAGVMVVMLAAGAAIIWVELQSILGEREMAKKNRQKEQRRE